MPFLDHPHPIAFAHRGGAAYAPENSWTAFEHAVKLGYVYLETDARATSDGKLMAFHDRNLDRVTDAEGPINLKSYREVAALRVGGSEPIPLIEDLLAAWPGTRFNIDLKDEAGIPLLPSVLRRTDAWDRVLRDLVLRRQAADRAQAVQPPGVHEHLAGRHRRRPVLDRGRPDSGTAKSAAGQAPVAG